MNQSSGAALTRGTAPLGICLAYRKTSCPGIVWNHGFGGHKGNDRSEREAIARHGYIILSYTSRGFGDTPGQVDLMGAKEQQDLLDAVDWLIAPDNPLVGGAVIPDAIGQIGASYGSSTTGPSRAPATPPRKAAGPASAFPCLSCRASTTGTSSACRAPCLCPCSPCGPCGSFPV